MAEPSIKLPHIIIQDAAILLAGNLANWGLYGILLLQTYLYSVSFPKDRILLKVVVSLALILETVHTTLTTHDAFKFFAFGFLNPASIDQVNTGWFSVPILTGLIASLTQSFYCYRIARITRSRVAVGIIVVFSLLQLGGAIAIGIRTKNAKLFSRVFLSRTSFIATGIWDAGSAVCDLTIAGIMTYHLRKNDSGFEQTRNLISKIIRLTIETGSATALLSLIVMILAFLPGHPAYYQAFALVLGKAYSISMLVVLNSRVKVVSNTLTASWNESLSIPSISADQSLRDLSFLRHREIVSELSSDFHNDVIMLTPGMPHKGPSK